MDSEDDGGGFNPLNGSIVSTVSTASTASNEIEGSSGDVEMS